MDAFAVVVNFDVIEKLCLGIFEGIELAVFEHLVLDGPKARFHESVVEAVSRSVEKFR